MMINSSYNSSELSNIYQHLKSKNPHTQEVACKQLA